MKIPARALLALSAVFGAASASTDCPAPGELGPYEVGFAGFFDASPVFGVPQFAPASAIRALGADCPDFLQASYPNGCIPFDVWFPTDDDTTGKSKAQYPVNVFTLTLGAYVDVALSTAESCLPLVVYSHGNLNFSADSYELVETLASLGYIVVALNHVGNTIADIPNIPDPSDVSYILQTAQSRKLDITSVLDAVLASPLASRICDGQIAAVGPSFGAFTALAAANGLTLINNLPELPGAEPGFDQLPADERIKAVVAAAPFALAFLGNPSVGTLIPELSGLFPPGGELIDLADSDVPTLVLPAEKDERTPNVANADPVWETIKCTTDQTFRVDIQGAGHAYAGSGCSLIEQGDQQTAAAFGISTAQLPTFCASIGFATPEAAQACLFLYANLPSKVSAGCLVDEDVCSFFAIIEAVLDSNGDGQYVSTVNSLLTYGGLSLLDLTECAAIDLPTLSGDDAKDVVATYVTAFLETVFERDEEECFEDVLEEEYAEEEGLPVVPGKVFLEDFVEDVCGLSSSEDGSVRNLRARKAS